MSFGWVETGLRWILSRTISSRTCSRIGSRTLPEQVPNHIGATRPHVSNLFQLAQTLMRYAQLNSILFEHALDPILEHVLSFFPPCQVFLSGKEEKRVLRPICKADFTSLYAKRLTKSPEYYKIRVI